MAGIRPGWLPVFSKGTGDPANKEEPKIGWWQAFGPNLRGLMWQNCGYFQAGAIFLVPPANS
jgi:hypothetical protein